MHVELLVEEEAVPKSARPGKVAPPVVAAGARLRIHPAVAGIVAVLLFVTMFVAMGRVLDSLGPFIP